MSTTKESVAPQQQKTAAIAIGVLATMLPIIIGMYVLLYTRSELNRLNTIVERLVVTGRGSGMPASSAHAAVERLVPPSLRQPQAQPLPLHAGFAAPFAAASSAPAALLQDPPQQKEPVALWPTDTAARVGAVAPELASSQMAPMAPMGLQAPTMQVPLNTNAAAMPIITAPPAPVVAEPTVPQPPSIDPVSSLQRFTSL